MKTSLLNRISKLENKISSQPKPLVMADEGIVTQPEDLKGMKILDLEEEKYLVINIKIV